jgi:hypothetical protein
VKKRAKRRVPWKAWLGSLGALLAGSCALFGFCFTACNPPDRVEVSFRNVPADTERVGVVTEANGTVQSVPTYVRYAGQLHVHLPDWHWDRPADPKLPSDPQLVAWRKGDRYGVVTQGKDQAWRVSWFDATDVPIQGRSPLLGGGSVEFDLTKGRTEALPREQAEAIGLSDR